MEYKREGQKKLDATSTAAGPKNGQSDQKRNLIGT
jgi:hypothetical protein